MLFFYCADAARLSDIAQEGIQADAADIPLFTNFESEPCSGLLLAVDGYRVKGLRPGTDGRATAQAVPASAIGNLEPYRRPQAVTAAGGLVVRQGTEGPEVLLIYRRDAWDLPKGKLNKNESVEECALREVAEEIGVKALHLGSPLGQTVHGYVDKDRYLVKTTHWFLMSTPETAFHPETREGIVEATYVPWTEAVERVAFPSLKEKLRASKTPAEKLLT